MAELSEMLKKAIEQKTAEKFFADAPYRIIGNPAATLHFGGELLRQYQASVSRKDYNSLPKGTPFYWLAEAALLAQDYETGAFYIDAAVSEDLKDPQQKKVLKAPALLFFLINDQDAAQALFPIVKNILRPKIDAAIKDYNECLPKIAKITPLQFSDIEKFFLKPALSKSHWRSLVTTFISYFLEWEHRENLLKLRVETGTAEPFFMHLFKGALLFESLLKANPNFRNRTNRDGTLGKNLKLTALGAPLKLKKEPAIGGITFQKILQSVRAIKTPTRTRYDTVIKRTGQIRNTTGHNLGWKIKLTNEEYNQLARYVACACLHTINCLYRK